MVYDKNYAEITHRYSRLHQNVTISIIQFKEDKRHKQ